MWDVKAPSNSAEYTAVFYNITFLLIASIQGATTLLKQRGGNTITQIFLGKHCTTVRVRYSLSAHPVCHDGRYWKIWQPSLRGLIYLLAPFHHSVLARLASTWLWSFSIITECHLSVGGVVTARRSLDVICMWHTHDATMEDIEAMV